MCVSEATRGREIYRVPESRLLLATFERDLEGDIPASYSADRISDGRPIRPPFRWKGDLWVCVGIIGKGVSRSRETEFEAYRLTPGALFRGEPIAYATRNVDEDKLKVARAGDGYYHGMKVSFGKRVCVLVGPPARFLAIDDASSPGEPTAGEQLSLF